MPQIINITPSIVNPGNLVTLAGSGFGSNGQLHINGYPIPHASWIDTEITAVIPSAFSGQVLSIMVKTVAGYSNSMLVNINSKPSILSIEPPEPIEKEYIIIHGLNFGYNVGSVLIGGAAAQLVTWTPTSIACILPDDIGGDIEVVVSIFGTESAPYRIAVAWQPVITGVLNPVPGSEMSIIGQHFGTSRGKVYLNGTEVASNAWNDTTIRINLISGLPSQCDIKVRTTRNMDSDPYLFTTNSFPTILNYTPDKALQGEELTIIGSNFKDHGNVRASGIKVPVIQWLPPNQVRVLLPDFLVGQHQFVVESDGLSSQPYNILIHSTPEIKSTIPVMPLQGEALVVEGLHFGNGGTLLIDNIPVPTELWTDTRIKLTVPPLLSGEVKLKLLVNGEFSKEFLVSITASTMPIETHHIWNENLYDEDVFVIEHDGVLEVTLSSPYKPGSGDLALWVNGMRQYSKKPGRTLGAYWETNPFKITFDEPLMKDDEIFIEIRRQ